MDLEFVPSKSPLDVSIVFRLSRVHVLCSFSYHIGYQCIAGWARVSKHALIPLLNLRIRIVGNVPVVYHGVALLWVFTNGWYVPYMKYLHSAA